MSGVFPSLYRLKEGDTRIVGDVTERVNINVIHKHFTYLLENLNTGNQLRFYL